MSFNKSPKSKVKFESEAGLHRCQQILSEVKNAINYSDLLEAGLTRSLGCSRHQWAQRIRDTYGEPGLDEKHIARKLVEEHIYKKDPESIVPKPRTFVVANPV
ncbi:hypothetical protein ACG1BZ_12180 [Microbulbifer sp. CNSA002]|uniref:hypothetical protein n=1 Tax=unclassified Microbulbifer TaxID=2619833 RepID=UPI0039B608EA